MASFASALGAVLGTVTASQSQDSHQYLTYPGFRFPLNDKGLKPDGSSENFDFIHRINMVPTGPPIYRMNGRLVWHEFERVLKQHELPINPPEGDRTALRFVEAEAQFGSGRMTPAENVFYMTTTLPQSVETGAQWSTLTLPDDVAIESSNAALDTQALDWLSRMNRLPQLGNNFVSAVMFEFTTIAILRPWFEPDILKSRGWELHGDRLSDGMNPPRGRLPGYVTGLVVIRNLTFVVGVEALPDVGGGVMYRRVQGGPEIADALLPENAVSEMALPAVSELPKVLAPGAGKVETQIEAAASIAEQELGNGGTVLRGGERFPVPVRFDVAVARPSAEARASEARVEFARIKAEDDRLRQIVKFARFAQGFWDLHQLEIDQARAKAERTAGAVRLLDQLASFSGTEVPHVIALICDRVPLCPDPDPLLFPTVP